MKYKEVLSQLKVLFYMGIEVKQWVPMVSYTHNN